MRFNGCVSAARPNVPLKLKLLPHLARDLRPAASALGQTTSGLVAILVWNDHMQPDRTLTALPRSRTLVRVAMPCSLRRTHAGLARRRARAQRLSLNAYLEALIAARLESNQPSLLILASP